MLTAPHLTYSLLAPILVVLGGALVGVLVEAFLRPSVRRFSQVLITLATLDLALFEVLIVRNKESSVAAVTSVSIDKAGLFMQGTILVLALVGTLFIADSEHFTAKAAAIPGSADEAQSISEGSIQTEVFPLTLFAVSGMLLFPVATDLITLFVALEVLS